MRLIIAALFALLFVTPASATVKVSDINFGGSVREYLVFWHMISDSGETVEVDAPCISACTFMLGIVPESRICIMPQASFGVHQVNDGENADPIFSAMFYRWLYPEWLQEWIKNNGGLKDAPIYLYPEDVKDHIKLCKGQSYDPVTPKELINSGHNFSTDE